jgi:hypothetical protein
MLRASYGWFLIVPAGIQAASLQRFAAFPPGGSGFAHGAVEFTPALQMAGNDRAAIRAIRDFYNRWRFGDAASFSDRALLSLLARDARGPSLAVFYLPHEELTGFTLVGGDAAQPVPAPSGPGGQLECEAENCGDVQGGAG